MTAPLGTMPEVHQVPAGSGPNKHHRGMGVPALFNSPARGAGAAAGHAAAACVSARSESVGASVYYARDADSNSSLPHVARQAQNSGAGAAVNGLPSTIENAGYYTSADSTLKVSGSNAPGLPSAIKKVIWAELASTINAGVDQHTSISKGSSTAKVDSMGYQLVSRGRARRPAARVPTVPPVLPSVSPSVLPSVAPPVLPSISPSDLPPAGVTPSNAVAPAVHSVSPPAPAVSTNDMPISLPTGASAASTNDMPVSQPTGAATTATNDPKARLHVDRLAKPGIKLIAAAGTKALPVQTPDSPVSTHPTSPNLGRSEEKPKESKAKVRENKESKALQGTKKSKARLRKNKKSKTPSSETKPTPSPTDQEIFTARKERDYVESTLEPIVYHKFSTPEILTPKRNVLTKKQKALREPNITTNPTNMLRSLPLRSFRSLPSHSLVPAVALHHKPLV